jgi:hypothetical protein
MDVYMVFGDLPFRAMMIDYAKASICDDRWAEQALSRDRGQDNLTDSPSVLPTQAW